MMQRLAVIWVSAAIGCTAGQDRTLTDAGVSERADASVHDASANDAALEADTGARMDAATNVTPSHIAKCSRGEVGVPESWIGMVVTSDSWQAVAADGTLPPTELVPDNAWQMDDRDVWHRWGYDGPTEDGARAGVTFDAHDSVTTDTLVGVRLQLAAWSFTPDCDDVSGEPFVTAGHVLRDADGKLLVLYASNASTRSDGTLTVPTALLPEASVRWVRRNPNEECEYKQLAIEVTSADGKSSVAVGWGERGEVQLAGETYVLGVVHVRVPPSGLCDSSSWILFKKAFFHVEPVSVEPPFDP